LPPASRWARSFSAQTADKIKPDPTVLPLAAVKFEGVIGSTIRTKFEKRGGKGEEKLALNAGKPTPKKKKA